MDFLIPITADRPLRVIVGVDQKDVWARSFGMSKVSKKTECAHRDDNRDG
jgi:hypothetical protein